MGERVYSGRGGGYMLRASHVVVAEVVYSGREGYILGAENTSHNHHKGGLILVGRAKFWSRSNPARVYRLGYTTRYILWRPQSTGV